MSILATFGNGARYDITVVSHESTAGKAAKRFSRKGYSRIKNLGAKAVSAIVALMVTALMLLGNLSTAPAAHAGDWGPLNGMRDAICGTAYFNIAPEDRGLGPNTADPKLMDISNTKITAYEKYGMAGLSWTVWLGPKDHGQISGGGDVAGKQLIGMAGGNNSLDKWANKGKAENYPSFYNTTDTCSPVGVNGPTSVGNFLLAVTSWIINITNLLFQTATETSATVLTTLAPMITSIVGELKDALYLEFLAPVVMLGALYVGWKGLVKRSSTEAGTAAVWMFGATVAGFALLANPLFLLSVVDTTVSTINETTIGAITNAALGNHSSGAGNAGGALKGDHSSGAENTSGALTGNASSGAENPNAALCSVVPGQNGKNQTTDINGKLVTEDFTPSGNAARTSIRQIQCQMWYSFMYTPWVIGQFGVSPSAADTTVLTNGYPSNPGETIALGNLPKDIPLGKGSAPGNWALGQLDSKVNYPGSNKADQQKRMLDVAASQLYTPTPNGTWKGDSSMNRITTATLAMFSALGAGAMIAVVSLSMITLQIGLLILTLFAPLFLLVGAHPGFGRRIALGWLETMAGIAMKRIVLSVLLSVMLVFYSAVLSASASMDWLVSMIMVIAVSVGGFTYKDKLLKMFSGINLGGNGGLGEPELGGGFIKRAAGNVGKRAAGAALAGATGGTSAALAGATALANARRHNETQRKSIRDQINGEDPSAGAGPRPTRSGPTYDGGNDHADESASSGAGERPTRSGSADSAGTADAGSAEQRAAGMDYEKPVDDASAGAGGRPAEKEMPAGPQPETMRRMSTAERETLAYQKKQRIKQAMAEAPMINTRKAVFEAMKGARKQRNVVSAYRTGKGTAQRHATKAVADHARRIKQKEIDAQKAETAETNRINREARRTQAEAAKEAANLRKQQAEDQRKAYEANKNRPGNGKHRDSNIGLPPLN